MKKLLKLIGLGEIQYKLSDYGQQFYMHFVYEYIFDAVLVVLDIIFAITSKQIHAALIGLALIILLALYQSYIILLAKCGALSILDGECVSYDKDVKKIFRTQIFGKSNISIKADGKTYIVPVSHTAGFREGSVIRVIFMPNGIYPKDEDTLNIPNPVYVLKLKNTSDAEG